MLIEPTRITVKEYLEYWLENYAKTNVAPKTYETYVEFIRAYMLSKLGRHLLAKLQTAHIQQYYTPMLTSGRRKQEGGLSARSVLHQHRLLREALNQAVKWQFIARNPADAVVPPRPERNEMKALDEEQTARLLEAARDTRLYVPIFLAVTTGLRRGEILGLRWEDIDFDAGTLAVRQALGLTRNGTYFKQPKTAKSRRAVALPSLVVKILRAHKDAQTQQRTLVGAAYQDQGLVVPDADGTPWMPDAFSSAFRRLLEKKSLRLVRFHNLRHSHATQLLKQGVHPKVVSERLGHSTIGLTLDTYSHVLPGMQQDAAQRMNRALRAALNAEKRN